jgi:hypothetical protein
MHLPIFSFEENVFISLNESLNEPRMKKKLLHGQELKENQLTFVQ